MAIGKVNLGNGAAKSVKKMRGGGMVKKLKGGGMPMTTVKGKKVPAFAADGKGSNDLKKMRGGGMIKKMRGGGMTKKMRGGGMVKKGVK